MSSPLDMEEDGISILARWHEPDAALDAGLFGILLVLESEWEQGDIHTLSFATPHINECHSQTLLCSSMLFIIESKLLTMYHYRWCAE